MTLLPASQAVLHLVDILGVCEGFIFNKGQLAEIRFREKLSEAEVRKLGPSLRDLNAWCAAGLPHGGKKPHRTFDGMQLADWLFSQKPPLENVPPDSAVLIRSCLSGLSAAINGTSQLGEIFPLCVRVGRGEIRQLAGHAAPCWHDLAYRLGRDRYSEWAFAVDDTQFVLRMGEAMFKPNGQIQPFELSVLPVERVIRQWEEIVPPLRERLVRIDTEALRAGVLAEAMLVAESAELAAGDPAVTQAATETALRPPTVTVDVDLGVVVVDGVEYSGRGLTGKRLHIIKWLLDAGDKPVNKATIERLLKERLGYKKTQNAAQEIAAIWKRIPRIKTYLRPVSKQGYLLSA
ncbi:MAG: hypothetical protein ACYC35_16775 [Pirellulales bacterium]